MVDYRHKITVTLFGDQSHISVLWLVVALGLSIITFWSISLGNATVVDPPNWMGGAAILIFLAAWQAYRNRGLIISVIICAAPVLVLFILMFSNYGYDVKTFRDMIVYSIGWTIIVGGTLGLFGFLIGYVLRWRANNRRSDTHEQ